MRRSSRQRIRSSRVGVQAEGILPSWLRRFREVNPVVAGPGVDGRSSHTSHANADRGLHHRDGLLASHRRLEESCGEATRRAHICRSIESAAREFISDFVAQSQHRCFTQGGISQVLQASSKKMAETNALWIATVGKTWLTGRPFNKRGKHLVCKDGQGRIEKPALNDKKEHCTGDGGAGQLAKAD
ncbi:hypothetical protein MRX96_055399 [Rhipicephalus microplus]